MTRRFYTALMLLATVLLTSCMYSRSPYLNNDLAKEGWQSSIDTSYGAWTKGADQWFLTGDPTPTPFEKPPYSVMGTMEVKVPMINRVVTDGQFKVEIFSSQDKQSVYAHGLTADLEYVNISASGHTLYLRQKSGARREIKKVIVRIGAMNIESIEQLGSGSIEVIQAHMPKLRIISRGSGNFYLSGAANVYQIDNYSSGNITVLGAITPVLDIRSYGSGAVNVSGNVGIQNILHKGIGDINIIGANSDRLVIDADGTGKIGIDGIVDLKQVKAKGKTCVFLNQVVGDELYVYTEDKAIVGVAGDVKDVYLYATNASLIYAQSLLSHNAYARASYASHINVTGGSRVYAAATRNASVYFFGRPEILSQFVSGNGVVIPVFRYSTEPYDYNNRRRMEQKVKYKDEIKFNKHGSFKYKWVNGKLVRVPAKSS